MLEIIIEENCTNREYIVAIMEKLDEFIRNIVSSQNLDSLRYFVVADTEIENYCDSVKYYARLLNKDTYLTNDGSYFVAGKTIEGKISGGEYVQAIIIKSGLIIGMYNDLLLRNGVPKENVPDMGDMRNIGLVTVVHEIGHAVDNANVYSLSGCIDNKLLFNLDLELDEYIEKNSYSLWGEYFAESFPYRVLGAIDLVADNKEEQLKECIENFSKEKSRNAIVERVYRILYLYVHCTEYFDKDVASKNQTNYKIVPKGYFAYNPSRINVGSIDCQSVEDRVIVSPLYVVFKADERVDNTINKMTNTVGKHITKITTEDLRKYLSDYHEENNCSKSNIDNIRRILSSFFSWLEDEDYILKSPVRRIHKIKSAKTVKETYTDEMLEYMRDNCDSLRDLAIIDMLASTGMRVGELVHLNIEDVDFENRECVVLGKGSKERPVYFDARTKIHLRNYLESRNDDNPALFVSMLKPYNRLNISGVEIRLRELGRKLDITKVHPHKFRRTLATRAIDKGMPIEQVQKLLGHSKIDTTMQYAMVDQENVKLSHRKFIS